MAAAVDISDILNSAQNQDANTRNQAELQLKQFQQQSLASYLLSLATEIAADNKPEHTRQMAGLMLKNALDAPGIAVKAEMAQNWLKLDAGVKQQIKQLLLSTLPTQAQVARHTAALALAKIAAVELPAKQWPELVSTLLANMNVQPPNPGLKQSTLEALGYVCEEMGKLDEDVLAQEQINSILTAVVQGMRKDETDDAVRLAATVALYNALEFAQTNFENADERNFLMQVICEGTIATNEKVREASFECLVKIAAHHYAKLPAYMQDIFQLTHRAAKEDEEDVAKQAIEFWCTVAEEEIELQQEIDEGDSSLVHHHFIKAALQPLVTMLLEQLLKQEEDQDKEDTAWNLSMAAGTCLDLIATVVEDDVVPLVMPFVQANIDRKAAPEDWRYREAATFAFGSILEGPSAEKLVQLVNMGLVFFLNALKDPNSQVRHTTAWTIGRVFEFVHGTDNAQPLVTQRNVSEIVQALLASLQDEPHIAEKVCYALSQLAAGSKQEDGLSLLSPYFKEIIQALLTTSNRPVEVAQQYDLLRLQTQAFEAINEMVRSASSDTLPLVGHLVPVILQKIAATMDPAAAAAKDRPGDLQGLLCGVLQVIIQKLAEQDTTKVTVMQYADQIMEALLRVFSSRHATVHEEAMLAVGALTYACGPQFSKYMQSFYPVLEMGLQQHLEWQVCSVSVGVLGDVCRALDEQIYPYCDGIMQVLLTNLQSEDVQRTIKPMILSSFSDIALAIGDKFEKYLPHVLTMLQSAQALSVQQQQTGDEDAFAYNNSLRRGIFEAYSGIITGMSREKVNAYLTNYAPAILDFGGYVYSDKENVDESVSKTAVALLGDVASTLNGVGSLFTQKPYVQSFIHECRASHDATLAENANWAAAAIQKSLNDAAA